MNYSTIKDSEIERDLTLGFIAGGSGFILEEFHWSLPKR
jgi:hypothetical protein